MIFLSRIIFRVSIHARNLYLHQGSVLYYRDRVFITQNIVYDDTKPTSIIHEITLKDLASRQKKKPFIDNMKIYFFFV